MQGEKGRQQSAISRLVLIYSIKLTTDNRQQTTCKQLIFLLTLIPGDFKKGSLEKDPGRS
jgi:hypothetical protein